MTVIGFSQDILSALPEVPNHPSPTTVPHRTLRNIWRYFMSTERYLPATPTLIDLLVYEFGPEQGNAEFTAINDWRSRGNDIYLILDMETHFVTIAASTRQMVEICDGCSGEVIVFKYPST